MTTFFASVIESQRASLTQDHDRIKNEIFEVLNASFVNTLDHIKIKKELLTVINSTLKMDSLLQGLTQPQKEIVYGLMAFAMGVFGIICGTLFLVRSKTITFLTRREEHRRDSAAMPMLPEMSDAHIPISNQMPQEGLTACPTYIHSQENVMLNMNQDFGQINQDFEQDKNQRSILKNSTYPNISGRSFGRPKSFREDHA